MANDDIVIKLQADIRDLSGKVSQVNSQFATLEKTVRKSSDKINSSLKAVSGAANLAKAAFAAIAFGATTRSAVQLADAMTNMRSRIRLVTGSNEEAAKVQQRLLDVANRTRTEFTAVGSLYARLGRSADALGLSQERLIAFTETFSQALKISGASTAESESTILQLSQALASGRLQGAELNAVLEAGGRAATALADGLGVPIGSLKKLGEQGELTAGKVIQAIESQAGTIDQEFRGMSMTVGDAMTVARNSIAEVIGKINESSGATSSMSKGLIELSAAIKSPEFVNGLARIGEAFVGLAQKATWAVGFVGKSIEGWKIAFRSLDEFTANLFGQDSMAFTDAMKNERSMGSKRHKIRGNVDLSAYRDPIVGGGGGVSGGRGLLGAGGGGSKADAKAATNATERYNEALADLNFQFEQLTRSEAAAAYQETLRNELSRAGVKLDSARGQEIKNAIDRNEELRKVLETVSAADAATAEAAQKWKDMRDDAGNAVASAFERAILEGEKLRDVFGGLLEDLARLIFQKMVFDQISGAISAGLGGIIGGKALGGQVNAGNAYMVGESGPEVFVPRVPGNIVPRGKAGGGGVVIQSVVNAAPGTNRAELQAMLDERDRALAKRIPRIMVDKQRRNALSGAF